MKHLFNLIFHIFCVIILVLNLVFLDSWSGDWNVVVAIVTSILLAWMSVRTAIIIIKMQ